jgi:uncharacterized protein YndB with AHSA1/START domain
MAPRKTSTNKAGSRSAKTDKGRAVRTAKTKTRILRQKQYIPAAPDNVFQALVNPKLHAAFTGAKATGAARVGGKFTAWDGFISGKHLKLQPGRYIRQEWSTSQWPRSAPPSILEFRLNKKKDGTELTMVQSGVPAEQAEHYKKGWGISYWKPLKAYFKKHKG